MFVASLLKQTDLWRTRGGSIIGIHRWCKVAPPLNKEVGRVVEVRRHQGTTATDYPLRKNFGGYRLFINDPDGGTEVKSRTRLV